MTHIEVGDCLQLMFLIAYSNIIALQFIVPSYTGERTIRELGDKEAATDVK